MIKVIFFDLDNTLHDFRKSSGVAIDTVYETIMSKYSIDKASLRKKYGLLLKDAEEHAFFDGRNSGEYRTERLQKLLLHFNVSDPQFVSQLVSIYSDKFEKSLAIYPETLTTLSKLKDKYGLYLITEGPGDAQRKTIELLGLSEYFKRAFISGEERLIKSNGDLFKYAIKSANCELEEIALVGDSFRRDIKGGLNANIPCIIWFNSKGEKADFGGQYPYAEIRNLIEVLDCLEEYNLQNP